jgi:hypothetical protein
MNRTLTSTLTLALALAASAQTPTGSDPLSRLPAGLQVKDGGPRTYRFTCDYFPLDVKGNPAGPTQRLAGDYTRGLPGDKVRWTNVTANGQKREFMEGFTYRLSDRENSSKAEFFQGFPAMAFQERSLAWDTIMLESFGQGSFDKLSLNAPYRMAPSTVPLAGGGEFENKNVELTWIGVSRRNGQQCALIDYSAFFNKVSIKTAGFELTGRSHYWGQIWVSLSTKQIEYATLYEDVLGEMTLGGQPAPRIVNVFRKGVFERLPAAQ